MKMKLKRIALMLIGAVALLGSAAMTASCSDDDDKTIEVGQLPNASKTFIQTYFAGQTVSSVKQDKDNGKFEYKVYFENGARAEFNELGEWTDVDMPFGQAVPDGFVLQPIVEYVQEWFPTLGINEIEVETYGYDVELTDGYELAFSPDGKFIR